MALRIAITGAGPSGCMLARLLCQSNRHISVTIFESEASIDFRSQGGTLDLHESTGQKALREAGFFDEFLKYARYDGEAFKIADKKLLCYVKMGASKHRSTSGRPEIDRPKLRELLHNSLPEGTVQWSKKLVRVDAERTLHFADGSSRVGFDLIVGADGACRPFRRHPNAEQAVPELYVLVNRGSLFAFSDGKSIMGQYMGDGCINTTTWSVRPADWQQTCSYDVHDPAATKAAVEDEFADWDLRLLALVQKFEGRVTPQRLFMLPIGHKWEHQQGVTLIGDAAHLATPFAGEGVNLALQDALKLSEAIIAAAANKQGILDDNIAAFERDMFQRAEAMQQLTYDMMNAMFLTPGALRTGIEKYILRAIGGEMGRVATALLTLVVYAWFAVFKMVW